MSRPGTTITRSESRPARSAPTNIGSWFTAGITGTVDADAGGPRKPCKSLAEYAARFGSRASHSDPVLFDSAFAYFKEGGNAMFVSKTADATDPVLTTALALFTKDLGPGQVSAPGRTTDTAHVIIANHADANNRLAVLDAQNTAVVATLTASATPAGLPASAERVSGIFAPWVTIPGSAGGTVTIPPSAIVAGLMSYNDSHGVDPNQPSAGILGVSIQAVAVSQTFIDADRVTLNANGVNLIRFMGGDVKVYGYRSMSDPSSTTEANYLQLSSARLLMLIQALLDNVAEQFVFRQIDGKDLTISEFGGELTGALIPFWQSGALYGDSPQEAFRVDVGPNVNTDATIANGELKASIQLRISPFAEEVEIDLVKVRITEAISA